MSDKSNSLKILTPPLLATLYLSGILVVMAIVWAFKAKIPLTVNGTGVLLPIGKIFSYASNNSSEGYLYYFFNQKDEYWQKNALKYLENPLDYSNDSMIKLAKVITNKRKLEESIESLQENDSFVDKIRRISKGLKIKKGKLLAHIQSETERAKLESHLTNLDKTLKSSNENILNTQILISTIESEMTKREQYLHDIRKLEAQKSVTRTAVLQEISQIDQLKTKKLELNQKIITAKQKIFNAYVDTREKLSIYINKSFIYAKKDMYIDELLLTEGTAVSQDQNILKYTIDKLEPPTVIPVYITIKEASSIYPGMKLLATPTSFKRSEVGGIYGKVLGKKLLPSSIKSIETQIGSKILAEQIAKKEKLPTMIVVALERKIESSKNNQGGYKWSSNSLLPFPPSTSDELDVQITTRNVTPVELVMPVIREILGISSPDNIQKSMGN